MEISYKPQNGQSNNEIKPFYLDLSLWALIVSNLVVAVWALTKRWRLGPIMWVYWCQSVIIGIFWFIKILILKGFSTEGYTVDGKTVEPTKKTKISTARHFLIDYGIIHLIYAGFLYIKLENIRVASILLMACVFLLYESFSFVYNRKWDEERKPKIVKLLTFPTIRILPMHVIIIAYGVSGGAALEKRTPLAIFMLLKIVADALTHILERSRVRFLGYAR